MVGGVKATGYPPISNCRMLAVSIEQAAYKVHQPDWGIVGHDSPGTPKSTIQRPGSVIYPIRLPLHTGESIMAADDR